MILCIAAHDIGKWDSPRPGADMKLKIKQEKRELIPMLCGLDKELKVFPCRKSEIDNKILFSGLISYDINCQFRE